MKKFSIQKLKRNSLVSGASIYLFTNIINAGIPFLLLPILTRFLNPAEYGEVAMFQTLLGALGAFTGLCVAGAANRKYYDKEFDKAELKYFIAACLQILLVSSCIVFTILLLLQQYFAEWFGIETRWVLGAVIVSATTVITQIRLGQWQVRKKASRYGGMLISQSLINMLLSLLLVIVFALGSDGRISAQILASTIFAALALILLKKDKLLIFFSWRLSYIKEALAIGVPLIPHVAGIFLLSSVDRFFINSELGLTNAGIYMVAAQFAGAMSLIFSAINNAFVPWLYEKLQRDIHEEKCQIIRYTYTWYALILSISAVGFLTGPKLITLIAGSIYAQAGEIIGWLILSQSFYGMYLMVTNYIFYSKRTAMLSLSTITTGLINVLLLVILIKIFGLKGAAIASCIAGGIRFILTWWIAQKKHPMPWFNFTSHSPI